VQWAWRLLLATGKPVYADAIERFLYNAFLPGVSLNGTEYFYVNPLQQRADAHADENRSPAHGRRGWFDCACCPPNIMRTFASLDAYLATTRGGGIQLHQFASGDFASEHGAVSVQTDYPWSGSIGITVTRSTGRWALDIRIPAWSDTARLTVNGQPIETAAGEYAHVEREFAVGDEIVLELDMTPHLYAADSRIDAARGAAAIERGPLVYAVEHSDNPDIDVDDVLLRVDGEIAVARRAELLDGIDTLQLSATWPSNHVETAWPYQRLDYSPNGIGYPGANPTVEPRDPAPVTLTAIPYYAWANREIGPMRVWVPTL
jgi:DUF1680 family protein